MRRPVLVGQSKQWDQIMWVVIIVRIWAFPLRWELLDGSEQKSGMV